MDEPRYHLGSVVHAKGETLEDFDGPLDVILLLLSKNKIEIQDIQISAILEQYLAYLDEMKRMDMEIASEFIAMASYLMYIKTRMLLSKAEQEEAQSEMDKLVESLQKRQRQDAYQQIQKAKQVISRLISHGVMRFLALFKGSRSRSEIVATFLAVLELCRLRSVSVGEDENGEPSVTYLKTPDADVQADIS